ALGATSRERVVCFEGAFHGRTAAAAAISDVARSGFPRDPFELTRLPWGDGAAARAAIDDTVAAVVLEPIQSMAGVRVPPDGFLGELRAACDASGAVLIFDEVQTGNGRTGRPFAAQTLGVTPDVLVTAKGAAGGLPIGITVLSAALAAELPGGILGSTFGGGPSVLAAACVVQRRIGEPAFARHVREVSAALGEAALRGPVREVRGAGLLLGAVLDLGVDAGGVRGALLEHGILVGTSNDQSVLRLTPPLTLTLEEAARLGDALESIDGAA
ncbi:MAG: aminotransferase class III-fold pyridoxal phosphate-dependent enzyme, partial [Planctomycetota bacterium]|nr:aminotransferase class III-fold pyridoxal phosphate-dependent enzyme [Planctomycetota bacterium]